MKERQIAICDREPEYTRRFADYSSQHQKPLFTVHGFTSPELLMNYAREHPLDMSLLSAELWEPEMKNAPLGQVYLLEESEYQKEGAEYPGIYKYQPCPKILGILLNAYAEQAPQSMGGALRTARMKRIGVYSPVSRIGKTEISLALGKEMAKQKRTLYLNLEEYSGFETLYPYEDGWSLSELMYFLKQGKKAFACKLEGVVRKIGGLDYIPPLKSPVELRYISYADWEALLEALERESLYEIVILDFSGVVDGFYELLGKCDRIYMPVLSDEISKAKLRQYEDTLKLLELDEILEKTRRISGLGKEELSDFAEKEGRRWCEDEK